MTRSRHYPTNAQRQRAYRERRKQANMAQLEARGIPPLPALTNVPGQLRWNTLVQQAFWAIQIVHGEMEAYYDDRSQQWQEDDRGQSFQERADAITELKEAIELFCQEHGLATIPQGEK